MLYTDVPKATNWSISVDVNAQVLGGFFISVVSHLPMVGHNDGFGCGIAPYDRNHTGAFHTSDRAVFNHTYYQYYEGWNWGSGALNEIRENVWYTIVLSVESNPYRTTRAVYNETGSMMALASGPASDLVQMNYVGFGASELGGNYTVRNVVITAFNYTSSPTTTPAPSPVSFKPLIAVNCQSSTSYSDFKVAISGNITCNGEQMANVPVLLSYSVSNGDSWNSLTNVTTDNDGSFSSIWMPFVSGHYVLKATYEGDTVYSPASTIVSFAVLPFEDQSIFSVTSNSTVFAFAFNATTSELSFKASGPDGTMGYAQVTIAKTVMGDADSIKVLLDGKEINYSSVSDNDSITLTFDYSHSIHHITISPSVNSKQSINVWILLAIVAILGLSLAGILIISFKNDSAKRK